MKNIHLIPTDKPSRLTLLNGERLLFSKEDCEVSKHERCINQHIYITNDENPKAGEWSLYRGKIHKCIENIVGDEFKKIILTTDQDLIKDGVQAIDDEFLEWFVNNPSCERVEVSIMNKGYNKTEDIPYQEFYKIIIPKEEPNKTHYLDELPNMDKKVLAKMWESAIPKLESKQETLEQAYQRGYERGLNALIPLIENLNKEITELKRKGI